MDLMVDIETLDTKPGGVILSIGALFFDRKTGLCPGEGMFHVELNIENQALWGGTVSKDTMDWWMRTDPEHIERVMSDEYQAANTVSVQDALTQLNEFCSKHYLSSQEFNLDGIWSQGDMDQQMIAALYRKAALNLPNFKPDLPWPYWRFRDTRTAYDLANFDPKTVERTGRHHHALDDCIHQAKCLLAATKGINRPFNGLSHAEAERLAMLAEEAGEVVQAVGKVLRHGYESYHPDDPRGIPNRALLENELADLHAVEIFMSDDGDIEDLSPHRSDAVSHAMEKKRRYMHYGD